jgi:NAD-dependent DNA ligase
MIKIVISESKLNKSQVLNGKYQDQKVVITGFRDGAIEEYISSQGGSISNTINKKTSLLIIKDEDSKSKKLDAAQLLGIPIMTKDTFYESMNHKN